ncbi:hypothetical protein [Bacillus sp. Cr_A10]|uniref:hypothetical protein n=1 Tax=Bacillus sp. Cr_A10 TaxID=3033993 RepID=UPI0023DB988B|nr:hypothetical protein [Bacillus sp. Cr_A10]MDF2068382.1 hypothetical protein [Bacillus sp. Cr_A10]
MELFIEKVNRKKSSKPILFTRFFILLAMVIFLIMAIVNDLDISLLSFVFVMGGIGSTVDGIESYYHKAKRKVVLTEIGLGIVYFVISFILFF